MLSMIAGCGGCITIPEEKQRATERLGGRYFSPHEKRSLPVEWTVGFQLTLVSVVFRRVDEASVAVLEAVSIDVG